MKIAFDISLGGVFRRLVVAVGFVVWILSLIPALLVGWPVVWVLTGEGKILDWYHNWFEAMMNWAEQD
jgi:hypothetical protein